MDALPLLLGLALLLTHELDAMRCHEWRIFPGLSRLTDDTGRDVFIAVHVPLFALILWGLFGTGAGGWNDAVVPWFDAFLVGHLVAHLALTRHPRNEFRSVLSWVLIGGAAVAGAADLLVRL